MQNLALNIFLSSRILENSKFSLSLEIFAFKFLYFQRIIKIFHYELGPYHSIEVYLTNHKKVDYLSEYI